MSMGYAHNLLKSLFLAREPPLHYALIQRQHDTKLKYNGTHVLGQKMHLDEKYNPFAAR
jgi:hypothetical protein